MDDFSIIKIQGLNYSVNEREILKDINLEIKKGLFYSIVGPNGSGKTTLLRNISRTIEPSKNTICIENKDILNFKYKDFAKVLSYVPQNTSIDLDFTSLDVVLMGRHPYLKRFESEKESDLAIAEKSMKMTNTWHLKNKSIKTLSGGERQRVIIARALAQESRIMLLDEPISQLDIHNQIEIMDTIRLLNKKYGITVISVLHDLNIAAQYSDYLIFLNEGQVVSLGEPDLVLTEETIKKVYNLDVLMIRNPINGKPHLIPKSPRYNEL